MAKDITSTSNAIRILISEIRYRILHAVKGKNYSNLDEQALVKNYLSSINIGNKFCVDIAASDGIEKSNTYSLYKDGWGGLAVEFDSAKFSSMSNSYVEFRDVKLAKCMVTPLNVQFLLSAYETPNDFDFLNLDIDGYDYF